MTSNEISPLNAVRVDSDKTDPASHPPEAMESGGTTVKHPPGAYPPGAYPPGAYPPGAYPPGAYPPGAYPPGAYAPGAYPPGAYPPGAYPPGAYPPGVYTPDLMSAPALIPNSPPGLEYLAQVDQLLVHQQLELLEVLIGFETNNKYQIKNSIGQPIFFAAENTDVCTRICCGNMRPFEMKILSNVGQVVMTLYRPLKCMACCCPCCLQELEVYGSSGEPLGYIIQDWHPFLPKFTVQNERKEPVLKIDGPCCPCSCMGDVDFLVKNLDETETIGKISKQWMGIVREMFTDADNFGIQFPMDLDLKMKAVMLGACFLIDFMFFEKNNN